MNLKKQKIEIAATALILALAGFLQYVAYTSKVRTKVNGMQSMTFPKIILYLMMVLCACVLFNGVKNYLKLKKESASTHADTPAKTSIDKRILLTILLVILYALMWNVIGFTLSSLLFMFIESMLLDRTKPLKQAVIIAVIYTIIVYLVFGVCFGVAFPEPIVEAVWG